MIPGLRGTLVSNDFAEHELAERFRGRIGEDTRRIAARRLRAWRRAAGSLGPASSVRATFDVGAAPLAVTLGFHVGPVSRLDPAGLLGGSLDAGGQPVGLLVAGWGERLDRVWRDAVRHGIRLDADWCLCFNVREIRLVDTRRSYARAYVGFDLADTLESDVGTAALWALLRAEAFTPGRAGAGTSPRVPVQPGATPSASLLAEVIAASGRHAAGVCHALERGVLQALAELLRGLAGPGLRARFGAGVIDQAYDECLTLVYRLLFLLFAEARGLMPLWHPVYRDSYSLETLRDAVDQAASTTGVWPALVAVSRLVHAGCRAGDLRVTPFNGRLFAPSRTPLAETVAVPDEAAARALSALSTQPGRHGRVRITYRDLGVEQLGAVYETAIDYRPEVSETSPAGLDLRAGGGRRKATGSFYTPSSVTDYLVRRTLHPVVARARSDDILRLRVLDPAMGSGAFLVATCRYLASAYEGALVREGACHDTDLTDADRAGFRRRVAQQCLFGVDVNPMAVQLARLSLWLATLAADRPLTFLDHHLAAGDSLVGASLADLARQAPGRRRGRPAGARLPLFADLAWEDDLRQVLPARLRLAGGPGDTLADVRAKEALLADLDAAAGVKARWKRVADLWCAWWFWTPERQPPRTAFAELARLVLDGTCALPDPLARQWLREAADTAARSRFFHWPVEFPEAFFDADGSALASPGFDAVLANPPWDMLQQDDEHRDAAASRDRERRIVSFARESGIYRALSDGHSNSYQLFVERAVRLARPGGRIGLVVPWGLASDRGSAPLRRLLLDRCRLDPLTGMDNAARIFPIHRSVRFLLLTATTGGRTEDLACRFGERDPARLDAIPDSGGGTAHFPVHLARTLLARLSGDDLAIPDVRHPLDVTLLQKITMAFPPLASADGWNAHFGRELNATDDRPHFTAGTTGAMPVVEGKQVQPFSVDLASSRACIDPAVAARLIDPARSFHRARLAYRDVASATNRLTLIAAILPPGCLTTHTLFCLKTPLDDDAQAFLCGILNSFVANYLVRLHVVSHVTVALVDRLPVPKPPERAPWRMEIQAIATGLSRAPGRPVAVPRTAPPGRGRGCPRRTGPHHPPRATRAQPRSADGPDDDYSRLQALVAALYGLTEGDFVHVLATFPLVEQATRARALDQFRALARDRPPPSRDGAA